MQSFKVFLIVPPGLEDLAQKEVELKCPVDSLTMVKGGIEIDVDLAWIEKAHLFLKIPTRILARVTEFKIRDFPKLHQKISSFNWTPWLSHPHPQWEISCSKSRLNHTGRIEETVNSALAKALIKQPLNRDWEKKSYPPQTFYIRLLDDNLSLSLDLTGMSLYKRGLQKIKGEAPLRENFAAAFAFEILGDLKTPIQLIDPMCGSGTLLTEALSFHQPLHLRPFAFETAPFYKGKLLRLPSEMASLPIKEAIGYDLNQELLDKVALELGDKYPLQFKVQDSLVSSLNSKEEMIMLVNPPYGERIKIEGKRGSFLVNAWKKYLQDKPLRFGWVLPSDMDDLFQHPVAYRLKSKRHLKNGGMAVTFWIWERN